MLPGFAQVVGGHVVAAVGGLCYPVERLVDIAGTYPQFERE